MASIISFYRQQQQQQQQQQLSRLSNTRYSLRTLEVTYVSLPKKTKTTFCWTTPSSLVAHHPISLQQHPRPCWKRAKFPNRAITQFPPHLPWTNTPNQNCATPSIHWVDFFTRDEKMAPSIPSFSFSLRRWLFCFRRRF
jgi:hypothetical protein